MKLCPNCATETIPGSKFCHRCGDKIVEKTKICPSCAEQSPLASVFCHHCGFHFEGRHQSDSGYQPLFPLDFDPATLTDQVKNQFFKSLRKRVEEEHDIRRYSDYVERFYDSRFRDIYALRSEQIAEEILLQWERFGREALSEIDQRIEEAFDGLLDYFIIQFCPDLNGVILPSAILKYERLKPGQADLWPVIYDFLDFEREKEVFYFDFIAMPEDLLANACKRFLYADRKEKVYFICDLTLKGTCKEGFAMTDRAIYWRNAFDKPRKAVYSAVKQLKRERDYLTIDGYFFNVNTTLNLKLYKLLKKLRGRRAAELRQERIPS